MKQGKPWGFVRCGTFSACAHRRSTDPHTAKPKQDPRQLAPRHVMMRATAMMKKIKAAFVALFFFPPTASVSTFSSATISPPSACPVICACVYLLRITAARLKNPPCRNAVAPVQWQPSRANTHVQGAVCVCVWLCVCDRVSVCVCDYVCVCVIVCVCVCVLHAVCFEHCSCARLRSR